MEKEPIKQPGSIKLIEAQVIQRKWESLLLGEETTPADRLNRWWDEALELFEIAQGKTEDEFNQLVVEDPAFAKEVGMEAIDNIIILLSLIDHLGLDAENLFMEKIARNFRKYSLQRFDELLGLGFTRQEAMSILKKEWDEMTNS